MLEFLSNVYLDTDDPIDGTELEVDLVDKRARCTCLTPLSPLPNACAASPPPFTTTSCCVWNLAACGGGVGFQQSPLWATMSYLGSQLRVDCETPGKGLLVQVDAASSAVVVVGVDIHGRCVCVGGGKGGGQGSWYCGLSSPVDRPTWLGRYPHQEDV